MDAPVTRESLSHGPRKRPAPIRRPVPLPPPARVWTDEEYAVLRRGHRSRDMDDKWDAFVERDRLHLHRSWTGRGIYEARFARSEAGWSMVWVLVEGDRESYRRTSSDAEEAALLERLVDLLIRWPA